MASNKKVSKSKKFFTGGDSLEVDDPSTVKEAVFTDCLLAPPPSWLLSATQLTSLGLVNCCEACVPDLVFKLQNLRKLSLDDNQLLDIPEGITALSELRALSLSRNNLQRIPPCLRVLTKLESLSVDYNSIYKVPLWIAQGSKIKELRYGDNPIIWPSKSYTTKGWMYLRSAMKMMEDLAAVPALGKAFVPKKDEKPRGIVPDRRFSMTQVQVTQSTKSAKLGGNMAKASPMSRGQSTPTMKYSPKASLGSALLERHKGVNSPFRLREQNVNILTPRWEEVPFQVFFVPLVGCCTDVGGRDYQEDRYEVIRDVNLDRFVPAETAAAARRRARMQKQHAQLVEKEGTQEEEVEDVGVQASGHRGTGGDRLAACAVQSTPELHESLGHEEEVDEVDEPQTKYRSPITQLPRPPWLSGMKRPQCRIEHAPILFAAVYDGHGGAKCAEFALEELSGHLFCQEDFTPQGVLDGAMVKKCMEASYLHVEEEWKKLARSGPLQDGTTAVTVALVNNQLVCGNVGDSRAVMSRSGEAVRLSVDHKPYLEEEKDRIHASGGTVYNWGRGVYRVDNNLAVSRSLGDIELKEPKELVSAVPYVYQDSLTPDDQFLILASDGLWDVKSDQEAVKIVVKNEGCPHSASRVMVEKCARRVNADNTTVIVAKLEWYVDESQPSDVMAVLTVKDSEVSTPHLSRELSMKEKLIRKETQKKPVLHK
mmetsp:Transcript_45408/g.114290  ORF Transcript_45408/g.114290 Transcript_45408/m.114290 type:complete len:709 (+) Transcript_45408:113-2239(+)